MESYAFASVSANIGELIQARTYEKIICNLMNKSTDVFPGHYEQVIEQSNNECDFVDEFGNKYEAKLLFEESQCRMIVKGLSYLDEWIESILKEINESSYALLNTSRADITSTTLYRELLKRLNTIRNDEVAILFIPFPIVPESEQSVYMQFTSNILTLTYDAICRNTKRVSIGTYIIYPSAEDRKIVIRDLDNLEREFLPIDELEPYVSYSVKYIN